MKIKQISFFKFLKTFLIQKKFALINSPFQLINLMEYQKKINSKILMPILVGYVDKITIAQVKNLNKDVFKLKNIFFLNEIMSLRIFLKILFLKKNFLGFQLCLIGDLNYHLFKAFYIKSKKNIILDDGTAILDSKNFINIKKTLFFTIFKKITNSKNVKILENNLDLLKTLRLKNQKFDKKSLYILGSASIERNVIEKKEFDKIINLILKRFNKKKIFYIPHRYEKAEKNLKKFKKIKIKKFSLPVEFAISNEKTIPSIILGFYSTALFSLDKLYGKKINIYNIQHSLDAVKMHKSSDFLIDRFRKIKKQAKIYRLKTFN